MKLYDFSAGRAIFPEVVLEKVQKKILAWHNSGMPASTYDAMLEFGVNALTSFMSKFERKYG